MESGVISENNSMKAIAKLRIIDEEGNNIFCSGAEELFLLIEETGSVRHAAEKMGLSYSKAWKIVNRIEKAIGKPAINRIQGGKGGGKAELTADGKRMLSEYISMKEKLDEFMEGVTFEAF